MTTNAAAAATPIATATATDTATAAAMSTAIATATPAAAAGSAAAAAGPQIITANSTSSNENQNCRPVKEPCWLPQHGMDSSNNRSKMTSNVVTNSSIIGNYIHAVNAVLKRPFLHE